MHVNAADGDIPAIYSHVLERVLFKDKLFHNILKADSRTSLLIREIDVYKQFKWLLHLVYVFFKIISFN